MAYVGVRIHNDSRMLCMDLSTWDADIHILSTAIRKKQRRTVWGQQKGWKNGALDLGKRADLWILSHVALLEPLY